MALVYYSHEEPPPYNPEKEEKELIDGFQNRLEQLKSYRSAIKANAYDPTKKSRTIEKLWDWIDFNTLPHKYNDPKMKDWMADDSRPMIYSKLLMATAQIVDQNPEIQIFARSNKHEAKENLLSALYSLEWDLSGCRSQLIQFTTECAKYGFSVGRRYHRIRTREIKEITVYDPESLKHETEKKEITDFDGIYFENLPIRDVWIDDRARPYDATSIRDWSWRKRLDWSTFQLEYPTSKYPNAKHIKPQVGEVKDQNELQAYDVQEVELYFYEDMEHDMLLIYAYNDKVLLYHGPLPYDHKKLSCVTAMWSYRNAYTVYGIGLPELLEGNQKMLDRVGNMRMNQVLVSVTSPGFYGGQGNPSSQDLQVEPMKIKKLQDADKLVFVKIPPPDASSYQEETMIKNDAEEWSGISHPQFQGKKGQKTLGQNIMEREAGLQRMKLPLEHIEMALEYDAGLCIALIQQIYERPTKTSIVRKGLKDIVDPTLFQEYLEEIGKEKGNASQLVDKFPQEKNGTTYRNHYRERRLAMETDPETNELSPSDEASHVEITPSMIRGEFDVKIKALSTVPISKELLRQQKLQLFGAIVKLPYTDIYKAQRQIVKTFGEKPDDWMKDKQQIQQEQQKAQQQQPQPGQPPAGDSGGGAEEIGQSAAPAAGGSMIPSMT